MAEDGIVRGDYEEVQVVVTNPPLNEEDEVGPPRNITNDRLVFRAKFALTDTTDVILKTSDDPDQIERTDALNGIAVIKINPEDTLPLTKTTTLKCTLEVIDFLDRPSTTFHSLRVVWRGV